MKRIGSLFTGTGGLDHAVAEHYGGELTWYAEIERWPSKLLEYRYPGVPNFGDITKVDWSSVPPIDILTGGVPCQDVSHAGHREGLTSGTRTGLWYHMAAAIEVLRPEVVVFENVQGIRSAKGARDVEASATGGATGLGGGDTPRALAIVLSDLARLGYVGRWGSVRASDAGAPHRRERVFIVARSEDAAR